MFLIQNRVVIKFKREITFLVLLMCITFKLSAQDTTKKQQLFFSGFIDTYYLFDLNKPEGGTVPLAYSHNRHNEFAINHALISLNYSSKDVRSIIALHAGTYPEANYAAEPLAFRYLHDASIGYRLHKKLWLDAGVFGSSHIGFEADISKNNWALTRSLCAENTPYYESGIKLSYEPDSQILISILALNGWQNIRDNNNTKAFGSQVTWKPTEKLTLNSSTFLGNEKADTLPQIRFLHNFYTLYLVTKKLSVLAGFDIGMEQALDSTGSYLSGENNYWYNPTFILRYNLVSKFAFCSRVEFYSDEKQVILPASHVFGYSVNLDYSPQENIVMRVEYRNLKADKPTFKNDSGRLVNNRPTIALSMTASF